ncbi:MAG: hypothetical protein IT582_09770 [Opitutaceae bacterium]|nr:hypothetical protein [Opitutaceae bacterium]
MPHRHHFDLTAASARFDAFWRCGLADRPPVSLWVKHDGPAPGPVSHHPTLREQWMDVDFQVERALARLQTVPSWGDTIPSFSPNLGPNLTATLFGVNLEFGEITSWCDHTLADISEWERFLQTPANFDNIYWQTIERMITRAAERFPSDYIIAMPDLHGNYDILSDLRGPENLCLDMVDDPDLVMRAVRHASQGYREAFQRMHQRLSGLGQPSTTWAVYLHDGPAYVPSCDFWCLVSADVGREMIVPLIEFEMAPLERSIFHLDGPQALRHLDSVLRLPGLNALQWVFGDGQGRAIDWLHIYRQALDANIAVQILAVDAADALATLRALGPRGLWLQVCTPLDNDAHAAEFLDAVAAASR